MIQLNGFLQSLVVGALDLPTGFGLCGVLAFAKPFAFAGFVFFVVSFEEVVGHNEG